MLTTSTILLRLTLAALLGAAIGVERDLHKRPAGIRTSAFVCLASALFTILSVEVAHRFGDPSTTRIVSNLVQGIGFLGAGAILRENGGITGLTTAATIFVEAAIGMAAGAGFYAVAGFSAGLVLFGLVVMAWVARRLNLKVRVMVFRFTTSHAESVAAELQQFLAEIKVPMQHFRISMAGAASVVELEAEVTHRQQQAILERVNRPGIVSEVMTTASRQE
ncbi:MAG: MgtC/SapB family protein [Acidobacteriia bacterium]|nr:MgtC/SapB family protein [Terriglobia bacterium]